MISFQLDTCYRGGQAIKYDINDTSSLRCSNLGTRLKFGFGVPIYGWFGGFLHFPDTLYSPPTCSTSSFGSDWTLKYSFKEILKMDFEWSTEVRTVFASNDSNVQQGNAMGEYLNWVKTIHKTTQIFNVKIKHNNSLSINLKSRNEIKVCMVGYEKTTTERFSQESKWDDQENKVFWGKLQKLTDANIKEHYDKKTDIADLLKRY